MQVARKSSSSLTVIPISAAICGFAATKKQGIISTAQYISAYTVMFGKPRSGIYQKAVKYIILTATKQTIA